MEVFQCYLLTPKFGPSLVEASEYARWYQLMSWLGLRCPRQRARRFKAVTCTMLR